jgi:hypothetical protein
MEIPKLQESYQVTPPSFPPHPATIHRNEETFAVIKSFYFSISLRLLDSSDSAQVEASFGAFASFLLNFSPLFHPFIVKITKEIG